MPTLTTEPIRSDWTDAAANDTTPLAATAADLVSHLARVDACDLTPTLLPLLADAARELARAAGIAWSWPPDGRDDPPVALVRLVARAAGRAPHAAGPHTARLVDVLRAAPTPP
jgi:hypothetical protein